MSTTWTSEQQMVIDLRDRNILVSAAAGSGKTAVLVERIITMITDPVKPVNIDELLVVTFTKAAAAEMKERIGKALEHQKAAHPEDENLEHQIALLGSAQITTIHSFCLYVIRNYFTEIDLDPSTRVADDSELELLKADTMTRLMEDRYASEDEDFINFVDCYARGKTDVSIEEMILDLYRYSRSNPWPEKWLNSCLDKLDITSTQELAGSELLAFLLEYFHMIVADLREQLIYAKQICQKPDGPVFYEEAIDEYICFVDDLLAVDQLERINALMAEMPKIAFSRKRMPDCTEFHKKMVTAIRDAVKKKLEAFKKDYFYTDFEHMLADIRMARGPMKVLVDLVLEFSERFQALKEDKHVMDFGDLEHFALDILIEEDEMGNPVRRRAAGELAAQFKEILCDEYQDSNLVQETILTAVSTISEGRPDMFMVGDVKQSIYKFRLAKPELFMEKYDTYTLTESDYQRIDLYKNFRSRKCVVDFVNLIFEHIMGKKLGGIDYDDRAALYLGADYPETEALHGTDTEVLLLKTKDEFFYGDDAEEEESVSDRALEAKLVGMRIQELFQSGFQVYDRGLAAYRQVAYRDIAILLRSTKGYAQTYVDVLSDMGIPVHSEVNSGFFETYEIRTAVCLLSIIDNPLQDIELAAVMKSCVGGFSDEELAMIRTALKKAPLYSACLKFLDPSSDLVLSAYYDLSEVRAIRLRLQKFVDLLEYFRDEAAYMNIHQLILDVFEKTDYDNLIAAMPNGRQRQANLEMFIERAVAYERTSYKGLFNFVRYIRNLKTQETDIGEVSVFGEQEDVVRIVTIHKSKGLEYPVVFVSGLSKKFNKMDANQSVLMHTDYGLGPEAVDVASRVVSTTIFKKVMAKKIVLESLSEELRVLYVALTRAREKLILTASFHSDMEKLMLKWQKSADTAGAQLSLEDLESATGYIDWIMPVLYQKAYLNASEAKVSIRTLTKADLVGHQAAEIVGNFEKRHQLLEEVAAYGAEHSVEDMQPVFDWVYPDHAVIHMPSKLSISEIKKRFQSPEVIAAWEGESFLDTPLVEETEGQTPLIIEEDGEVHPEKTPAERMAAAAARGSAVHKLMELADFGALRSLDQVKGFIQQCVEDQVIASEMAAQINPWKIFNMVRSSLGKRMAAAAARGDLHREAQFIMSVDAREIFVDELSEDQPEIILTQGIIDVYFEEADGIVLMDYKTDYIRSGHEQELAKRYQKQLLYYQKAIERITHKQVKEKWIYAFATETIVPVP